MQKWKEVGRKGRGRDRITKKRRDDGTRTSHQRKKPIMHRPGGPKRSSVEIHNERERTLESASG